ncbi:MAG: heavy metal translocating P-type ATPase metal-binding domain-containing protein, partial [Catalinimonas sp.]
MLSAAPAVDTQCHHCGEPCPPEPQYTDEKPFCCEGCRTVYELLSDHALDDYYALRDRPGGRRVRPADGQYAALDQPDVSRQVLDFREGDRSRVTFLVPAIHCSACVWLLERLPQLESGVR